MDQVTNSLRRANWLRIVQECHNRPSHMSAKQWLKENDISAKSYYYWQRKFRTEAATQIEQQTDRVLPSVLPSADVTFMELPLKTIPSPSASTAARIRMGDSEIELSEEISDEFLLRILKAVRYAG